MEHPVLQKILEIKDVDRCNQILCVPQDMVWVSNGGEAEYIIGKNALHLILADNAGITRCRVTDACIGLHGFHTVNKDNDLIYIAENGDINKLYDDLKTETVIEKKTDWEPSCVYCSKSTGDVFVGMYMHYLGALDLKYKYEEHGSSIAGRVNRYNPSGLLMQILCYDNCGAPLYICPSFITENNNGDVVVSDRYQLAVTESGGRHRFFYKGPPFGKEFLPQGICTDALSNILVCDYRTKSVHLIDKDGTFCRFLLTQKFDGISEPRCLSIDVITNLLWVGSEDRNVVSVYKYITGRSISFLFQELFI